MDSIVPRDPLHRGLKIEFRERFYPMGALLDVESNQSIVVEAARESFGRYSASTDSSALRYRIRLLVDPDFAEAPRWPDPVFRGHGNFFHIQVGSENFATADLQQRVASGFISPAMGADSSFFRSTILECLFLVMLTHAQHTYLHASAVVWEGKAILLAGPRLAGKSTLAYACAKADFQILSDDAVYVERSDSPRVWGKPWHMKLLPDTVRFFPEFHALEPRVQINNEVCFEVDVDHFLPGRAMVCSAPAIIFFLERAGGKITRVESVSETEALARMQSDLMLDNETIMQRHLKVWQDLACRLPAFRLMTSQDPHNAAEFLREFVGKEL